jgi:anhydro-N-acetylmuramic acid kinase
MDAWCQQHTGQPYDAAGRWAASGEVDATLLRLLCADSYFQRTGPRSTGRDHFSLGWLQAQLQHLNRSLAPEDVQATLLELTASSIAAALAGPLDRVILCGGGVFNTTLTAALQRLLGPVRLEPSDLHGLPAMQVEAAAFGWLALQALAGRPGNCTAVTGAQGPRVLGAIYPA